MHQEASLRLKVLNELKNLKDKRIVLTNYKIRHETVENLLTIVHESKLIQIQQ